MALTRVGKFVGLLLVAGVVGGGIYAYKTMIPKAPVEQQVDIAPAPQQPEAPQPVQQAQETPTQAPVYTAPPTPVQAPQEADASSNRGMQFLLNQGKK
jgi:hypothetical protein